MTKAGDEMKGCSIHTKIAGIFIVLLAVFASAKESMPDMPAPPPPPIPKITALQLLPDKLTISDGRDARRGLVMGMTESGKPVDLTASAQFKSESKAIEVGPDGYILGKEKGTAEMSILAGNLQAQLAVSV